MGKRRYAPVGNPELEARLYNNRWRVALACCFLALGVLGWRMAKLQIIDFQHYQELAKDNRVRVRPIAPTRGRIFDRYGRVLAENLPSYQLEVIPELIPKIPELTRSQAVDAYLDELGLVVALTDNERKRFVRALKRYRYGSYSGLPLKFRLTEAEVAQFSVNRHRFAGVDIEARLNRNYPYGAFGAHTVGYVGRIDEQDLQDLGERADQYDGSTHIGKTGIEEYYEPLLHGEVGFEQVEVNVQGRVQQVLESKLPLAGKDIYLSLDMELQKVGQHVLGDYAGALVALDPKTGELLAMVSTPSYDPNLFVNGISVKDYAKLRSGDYLPLFNRALKGRYPPGSTIKPFVGLGGIELGIQSASKEIPCFGFYQLPNDDHKYRDWKRWGHGKTNLNKAIAESCDVYFYDLANHLGIDRMHDYMQLFGFGVKTGVDLHGESQAHMPSSKWKKRSKKMPWFPGETLIVGIGQGYFVATPLQLAVATGALVNNGKMRAPHLLKTVVTAGKQKPYQSPEIIDVPVKDIKHWKYVQKAMEDVVHSPRGTARRIAQGAEYRIAGKTGTAQVFSIKQDERYDESKISQKNFDHALFLGYAPADDPKIVVAVIVENGKHGSSVAAPMARAVMDYYLLGKHTQLVRGGYSEGEE